MHPESTLSFTHLIIPILGLSIPIVAIVAHYLGRAYRDRQRHLTIREFARAGQPVPPELLADTRDGAWPSTPGSRNPDNPTRILLPAVINIGIGLGLMGLFAVMSPGSWWWGIGLLPLCLGLGLLALWAALRQQPPKA